MPIICYLRIIIDEHRHGPALKDAVRHFQDGMEIRRRFLLCCEFEHVRRKGRECIGLRDLVELLPIVGLAGMFTRDELHERD